MIFYLHKYNNIVTSPYKYDSGRDIIDSPVPRNLSDRLGKLEILDEQPEALFRSEAMKVVVNERVTMNSIPCSSC